jgi:hypothetical protein
LPHHMIHQRPQAPYLPLVKAWRRVVLIKYVPAQPHEMRMLQLAGPGNKILEV